MKSGEKGVQKTKEQRIQTEKRRLTRQFGKIDAKKKALVAGLIERAAFMRVELEDIEVDVRDNGFTEMFSQGNQTPYERMRPAANMYNSMNTNYQKIIHQLTSLLPKDRIITEKETDRFDEFVQSRED